MPSTKDILAVILGGGVGTRLFPLTHMRSKPAVPIAGKYRLIDIPISNCINTGIAQIAVLTQFNSVSLHRHITQTYNFDSFRGGWTQIWAAEQTPETQTWYQGTADAVRKQLLEIRSSGAKYVIILAGDHLYRMNYIEMAKFHWENKAEITVAVQPVTKEDAPRFGLLKRNKKGEILDFVEKPKDKETQKRFISRDDPDAPFLGSMGIYMFNTDALVEILESTQDDDFGGEVIPKSIGSRSVYGFDFEGYWRDIGTIRSFFETNLELAQNNPEFDIHDPDQPLYTRPRFLPGSTLNGAKMKNVLLADGCRIGKAKVRNCVIGLRSQVSDGAKMKNVVMMGADYYHDRRIKVQPEVPVGIGEGAQIENAIIDKNARIGKNVVMKPFDPGVDIDGNGWYVRDGIIVIPKNAQVADGTYIGPVSEKV